LLFFRIPHILLSQRPGVAITRLKLRNLSKLNVMKTLERITLATTGAATMAAAAFFIQQAIRARAERVFRVAAGESPYERKHAKMYRLKHV
jgi:recombinational DNA repair protein RecR